MKFPFTKKSLHFPLLGQAAQASRTRGFSSTLPLISSSRISLKSPMESTKASAISSTLSPHTEPFISRRRSSSAVIDCSIYSSPLFTCGSSPFQPQGMHCAYTSLFHSFLFFLLLVSIELI
jgi:hypothetical protein